MDVDATVVHIERVCCLECGTNYVKPTEGSSTHCNPGCPTCGYLGWISAVVPTEPPDVGLDLDDRPAAARIRA